MSKIDLQNYFDDALTFTLKDQEFKVDESYSTFIKCDLALKEIKEESKVLEVVFEYAFGKENAKKIMDLNLPMKAYKEIYFDILSSWTGTPKDTLKMATITPSFQAK